ncbi:Transcription initiation factor TFIIF subunit alpha [Monocercomonoides exilis]|uniref:Transcription initiation factor TFIIF subunit alpha n=1 Tax=Monocercomonoides exilis TaxID=2049356 RepID=UPI003559D77B|nr:Transcription initiation factor TFIIF subunit alpha [Monocercomonoides exilis]|eukprot:MONOS_12487.1-p1 / transcript=MONOS_12487.1 / gene=MONOS_12487 / organism=Monocercomonoides_exilis_PA203 / gene_product=Transcription initiation factor TFIIF subunit alpha / transcript_product=Transcription initiation factor TFIIF subunit alpha / location=Mono_scaffold00694:25826-27779(+) / protein_length=473 / sequence_SO=supercontig / SO=protein_coding / is_pseudo=false
MQREFPLVFVPECAKNQQHFVIQFNPHKFERSDMRDPTAIEVTQVSRGSLKQFSIHTQRGSHNSQPAGDESTCYAFLQRTREGYQLCPCESWFQMAPAITYSTPSIEEAEESIKEGLLTVPFKWKDKLQPKIVEEQTPDEGEMSSSFSSKKYKPSATSAKTQSYQFHSLESDVFRSLKTGEQRKDEEEDDPDMEVEIPDDDEGNVDLLSSAAEAPKEDKKSKRRTSTRRGRRASAMDEEEEDEEEDEEEENERLLSLKKKAVEKGFEEKEGEMEKEEKEILEVKERLEDDFDSDVNDEDDDDDDDDDDGESDEAIDKQMSRRIGRIGDEISPSSSKERKARASRNARPSPGEGRKLKSRSASPSSVTTPTSSPTTSSSSSSSSYASSSRNRAVDTRAQTMAMATSSSSSSGITRITDEEFVMTLTRHQPITLRALTLIFSSRLKTPEQKERYKQLIGTYVKKTPDDKLVLRK